MSKLKKLINFETGFDAEKIHKKCISSMFLIKQNMIIIYMHKMHHHMYYYVGLCDIFAMMVYSRYSGYVLKFISYGIEKKILIPEILINTLCMKCYPYPSITSSSLIILIMRYTTNTFDIFIKSELEMYGEKKYHYDLLTKNKKNKVLSLQYLASAMKIITVSEMLIWGAKNKCHIIVTYICKHMKPDQNVVVHALNIVGKQMEKIYRMSKNIQNESDESDDMSDNESDNESDD